MYNEKADTDGIYGNGRNALEFELKVKCRKNPDAPAGSDNPDDLYLDSKIFTRHMKWVPRPGQLQMLSDGKETTPNPGPVEDDILISKMRPGHEMDIKMFAVKGVGRDHAKFSPVCTAYYRHGHAQFSPSPKSDSSDCYTHYYFKDIVVSKGQY